MTLMGSFVCLGHTAMELSLGVGLIMFTLMMAGMLGAIGF